MLLLMLVFCLADSRLGQAAEKRPGAFIVTPREGASVAQTSEFSGKTFLRGQPLALVRAIDGNGHWWVQRGIQRNDRGQLKGTIQFGNALAEPGTRFAFVVVVVQTPLELEFFTRRESMAELPDNVPKSEVRSVVLGKPGDDPLAEGKPGIDKVGIDKGRPTKLGLAILKPLENAKVQRLEELVGRMESDDTPIVLVRPEGPDQQWWVQDSVIFGEGKYFKTKLRFGNDKTPVGTRFLVLVVSPKPGPQAITMQAGVAFSVLPAGIRQSAEVIVQLAPPAAPEETR